MLPIAPITAYVIVIVVINVFEPFFMLMVKLALASSAHSLSPEEELNFEVQQMAGSSEEYWMQE